MFSIKRILVTKDRSFSDYWSFCYLTEFLCWFLFSFVYSYNLLKTHNMQQVINMTEIKKLQKALDEEIERTQNFNETMTQQLQSASKSMNELTKELNKFDESLGEIEQVLKDVAITESRKDMMEREKKKKIETTTYIRDDNFSVTRFFELIIVNSYHRTLHILNKRGPTYYM